MPTGRTLKIDTEVPFGDSIYYRLSIPQEQSSSILLAQSHQFDRSYLAWEIVRKTRNPYFLKGTGLEGYFIGICQSPEDTLRQILQVSQQVLTSIIRLYRYQYTFRTKLLKTLTGEGADLKAMSEWSAQLGYVLAKLRCNLFNNRQAEAFRTETYQVVKTLPPIDYRKGDHVVRQIYTIDSFDVTDVPRIIVSVDTLNPPDQDAWLVAESIGKFGHPLVREFIRHGDN